MLHSTFVSLVDYKKQARGGARLSKSRSLLVSGLVVVDPGANDFYHLPRAKITGGIFLL